MTASATVPVHRSVARRLRPSLVFATPNDEPRARRVSEAIALAAAIVGLVALGYAFAPQPGFASSLDRFLSSTPHFLDAVWQVAADVLVVVSVGLIVGSVVRRRLAIGRDLLVATAVAALVWAIAARVVQEEWPELWGALRSAESPSGFASARVALPGAVVLAALPHLTLPMRRAGWRLLLIVALAVTVLGATPALGSVAALLIAVIAAATVHLAFGTSAGRPSLAVVRSALAELGVPIKSLGAADRQQAGVFQVDAIDQRDQRLVVRVYGRDAHDTAVLSTLWQSVWYRGQGTPLRLGRLAQVEHEAFLTLFARQAGIATDAVVTAGTAADDDALLVLRRSGGLLGEDRGVVGDERLVDSMWLLLERLHDAGIVHGEIDDRHVLVMEDSELGIVDLRGATLAATEALRHSDEVQVLALTLTEAGTERAVAGALASLGPERLGEMLPYLQPAVLTPVQRRQVREGSLDLDHLRTAAGEAIGLDPPRLQQLRRVTLGSVTGIVLPALAVFMLISGLAGLDLEGFVDEILLATWWLVLLGVLVAQTTRLAQAVSTLGASPIALPFGPVYILQLAVSYVNVAIPTAAARIAVNIRFFQRHGVPPGTALAAGALDGFSGFLCQLIVLAVLLLFTSASLDVDLGSAVDSAGTILLMAVVIAVLSVAIVAVVPRLRRFVWSWTLRIGAEAAQVARGLRSPRRLALLLGGNMVNELLFAMALGLFARSVGYPIGLGELLLVNITVGLLLGLMPVPGGIGVAEGGLTFALVQTGMTEQAALSAVLMYRLATFYLPPTWGYFALRWLERNEHL